MDRFSIENIIKKKLKGHREHIDQDELWASLGLEEEPKKRRAVWWIWGLLLLLILSAGGYLIMSLDDTGRTPENYVSESIEAQTTAQSETREVDTQVVNENIVNEEAKQKVITAKLETVVKENLQSESAQTTIANVKNPATEDNVILPVKEQIASTSKELIDIANTADSQLMLHENVAVLNKSIATEETHSTEQDPVIPQKSNVAIADVRVRENESCDELQVLDLELIDQKVRAVSLLAASSPLTPEVPVNNFGQWHLYSEYGKLSRSLQSTDRQTEALVALRNESETPIDYFALGLRYEHLLTAGLHIYAGLEYMQLNEKTVYTESDSTSVTANVTTVFTDRNGLTSTSTTAGTGTEISQRVWTYHNQYRMLSIPIGLTYKWSINKLELGVETGVALRLAGNYSGDVLDEGGALLSNPDYINTGLGLSWSAGLFASYQLTDDIALGVAPIYRKHTSNFVNSTTAMRQTYTTIGGRLSLVARF